MDLLAEKNWRINNMVKDRLTDNEIEHYHSKIVVRSLHDEKKGEMIWTVCCKKCGGVMFPYVKNMEKELVE